MGKKSVRMLCTVGTSLNYKASDKVAGAEEALKKGNKEDLDTLLMEWMESEDKDESRIKARELLKSKTLPESFANYRFHTAEIQTLIHWLKDNRDTVGSLHVILLPSESPKSQLTAHALRVYLKAVQDLFSIPIRCGTEDVLPVKIEVDTREKFLDSVAALFEVLDQQVADCSPLDRMVFCTSGGYKSIVAFAVMYAQIHSIPCLYTFERSDQAFELMHIPIGYAIGALDEEINLLKAIGTESSSDSEALPGLPQWVADTRALAPMLIKSYERGRRQFCGTGTALFDRLRACGESGSNLAKYLEGLLAENWSELWMGDQIPETVEHSRRHSKRLMEFASNFFRCAEPQMESLLGLKDSTRPELLALLIASIYLHDIGHTALSYPIVPVPGQTPFPLGLFPSAVREIHHLLTGALLHQYPERFFGAEGNIEPYRFLKICVPLLSEHHRGYTELQDKKSSPSPLIASVGELVYGKEAFEQTLLPLRDRFEERARGEVLPFTSDEVLKAAALLRVIDGCDVQSDRVVSPEYLRARLDRTQDEAKFLSAQLSAYTNALSEGIEAPLDDLKSATEGLDVDRVRNGTFVDEDGRIEKSCKTIYREVFENLKTLREEHSPEGDWGRIQTVDALRFAGLSLANRVAFKWEQFLHFYKHQSVGFVLPVKPKEGKVVKVRLYPADPLKDGGKIPSIVEDIEKEYRKVESVLKKELVVEAESASARDHAHE